MSLEQQSGVSARPTNIRDVFPPATPTIEDLAQQHAPDLLTYFVRRIQVPADAAELLNDTLVAIWRAEGRLPKDAEQARMWMFGVAKRVLKRHYRTGARHERILSRAEASLTASLEPELSLAEQAESHAFVREMVDSLPQRQRELVKLVHWDGFSIVEAAQHLGISASTARTHAQRAKAQLAVLLGSEFETEGE
ncbi:RNA polymerase sigma factor [Lysinibacter cavernae]|uniref:RNA polymerase sigma-70 factor (ECF subfamily) n=1 Tax=Lysinibacter cavernae TaxID=1640652 RepID=A0A7X5TSB1_9MICO|nr:RNA polymerase sigma factor [Lysinibacter cavernae]NIH53316.1 RNA polymerase sigma-70 factor (ECF subfamily) [Lysinibacter cavernae]